MNSTAKQGNNTLSKVDSLFDAFNKFIVENYEPSAEEQVKY